MFADDRDCQAFSDILFEHIGCEESKLPQMSEYFGIGSCSAASGSCGALVFNVLRDQIKKLVASIHQSSPVCETL